CGWLDDVDQAFVRPLLESFLGLFVRMRRTEHSKTLDAGRQRNGPGDAGPCAFDRIGDVAGGLIYDPMVIGLETDANALSSHTKNNCLLMVLKYPRFPTGKRTAEYSKGRLGCNRYLEKNN